MNLKETALDWIDAWNKKDIDRIMGHYSDDVLFFAPTVLKDGALLMEGSVGKNN
jgi:ketosteroid isomerase-like protein